MSGDALPELGVFFLVEMRFLLMKQERERDPCLSRSFVKMSDLMKECAEEIA